MSEPAGGLSPLAEIQGIVGPARREGRRKLLDPEAFEVLEALGIRSPASLFLPPGSFTESSDLTTLEGDRLVLKAVVADLAHKSDVGGVRVVDRDPGEIRSALAEMQRAFQGRDLRGFLLQDWIDHDQGLGGELLVSIRWTDDFGPVLGLGPGGLDAETLAALPSATSFFAPFLDSETIRLRAMEAHLLTPTLFQTTRGRAPRLGKAAFMDLLDRLQSAAFLFPEVLKEIEINPLVTSADGLLAVDALIEIGEPMPERERDRPLWRIDRLLRPERVGVMGVSRKMNPGRIVIRNLLDQGFPREKITILKPGETEIDGCRCLPDLASVPETLDLLVVALGAAEVPAVVEECIRLQKAESLIVIPGGLGELEGSRDHVSSLQETLRRSRDSDWGGPVINGGNCLGVRSLPGHIDTLFIPRHKLRFPETAETPLALISQSGALTVARASTFWTFNARYLISVGNQIDLTMGDYLEHLAGDQEIEVFACYVEGFRPGDGQRFLQAARRIVEGGRPVILYRAGRSREGLAATASHTASIAGPYEITRELALSCGVLVADTLADFEDLVRLATTLGRFPVRSLRLGALSNAGFECVAEADNLGCLQFTELQESTVGRLQDLLRSCRLEKVVGVRNPLDLTPIMNDQAFAEATATLLEDPGVDLGIVGCVPLTGALQTLAPSPDHLEDLADSDSLVARLLALKDLKPWVMVVDGGPLYDPMVRKLEEGGLVTFRKVDRAARLLASWARWKKRYGKAGE